MSAVSARPAVPSSDRPAPRRRPGAGRPPRPVVEHPESLWDRIDGPAGFAAALDAEMKRHGDSAWSLHKALLVQGAVIDRTTLRAWRRNAKAPEAATSLAVVDLIEHRYRLPAGDLRSRLAPGRAVSDRWVCSNDRRVTQAGSSCRRCAAAGYRFRSRGMR